MTAYPVKMTARELLVHEMGEKHRLHTVVGKTRAKGILSFTCSCGLICEVSATTETLMALRNVPLDGSS